MGSRADLQGAAVRPIHALRGEEEGFVRSLRDDEVKEKIARLHSQDFVVYGADKCLRRLLRRSPTSGGTGWPG